jgi:hypothetical protein
VQSRWSARPFCFHWYFKGRDWKSCGSDQFNGRHEQRLVGHRHDRHGRGTGLSLRTDQSHQSDKEPARRGRAKTASGNVRHLLFKRHRFSTSAVAQVARWPETICNDTEIEQRARKALDATRDMKDAPTEEELDRRSDLVRNAVDDFARCAAGSVLSTKPLELAPPARSAR